jgi:hypothetical protein
MKPCQCEESKEETLGIPDLLVKRPNLNPLGGQNVKNSSTAAIFLAIIAISPVQPVQPGSFVSSSSAMRRPGVAQMMSMGAVSRRLALSLMVSPP